jgi:RNA polymerase sigma-70 factor (ECF subfamily)
MKRPNAGSPANVIKWEEWLAAARGGAPETLGQLLEACRQYLLLVANQHLAPDLQGKFGASDVVQETFLEAQRDFGGFQGRTEEELLAWLRHILLNNLANLTRGYRDTQKRQVAREVPIGQAEVGELQAALARETESPSVVALAREQAEALDRALEHLPEHYRHVLLLRYQARLSFEEIGQKLERSAEAARKLWARAVEELEERMKKGKKG